MPLYYSLGFTGMRILAYIVDPAALGWLVLLLDKSMPMAEPDSELEARQWLSATLGL